MKDKLQAAIREYLVVQSGLGQHVHFLCEETGEVQFDGEFSIDEFAQFLADRIA